MRREAHRRRSRSTAARVSGRRSETASGVSSPMEGREAREEEHDTPERPDRVDEAETLPAWLHTLAPRAADPAREPRDEARDGPAPRLLAGATGPAGPITPGAQGACACAAAAAGRAWRSCARTADWLMTELRCCRCAMMEAGAEAPTESGQPGGGGSQHGGPGAATGGGRGGAPAVPRGGGGLRDAGDPLATNPGEQAAAPWAQPAAGLEVAARVYSVAKHA
mmetsp:Transcript_33250/g.107525  ORF Transcript_33250/g.107525 Transcript_33250/m.107525 type:complete len:223 (-) Transcript_33250:2259-2927(-)